MKITQRGHIDMEIKVQPYTKLEILQQLEKKQLSKEQAYEMLQGLKRDLAAPSNDISLDGVIIDRLKEGISKILGIPKERIHNHGNIRDYGFDSISFTKFSDCIEENFGITLSANTLFEIDTVAALSKMLYKDHKEQLESLFHVKSDMKIPVEEIIQQDYRETPRNVEQEEPVDEMKQANIMLIEETSIFPTQYWQKDIKNADSRKKWEPISCRRYQQLEKKYIHLLVTTDNHKKVEVMSSGSGSTMVIMGGVGMAAPMALKVINDFSKKHRVLYIHHPGCGLSQDLKDYGIEERVSVVFETLKQLGIMEPIHFVGISWGALLGQYMAAMHPEKLSTLTLISPIYEIENEKSSMSALEAMLEDIRNISKEKEYENLLIAGNSLDMQIFTKYMDYYLPDSEKTYNTYDLLNKIPIPVLVMYGKKDTIVKNRQSEVILSQIEDKTACAIEHGGHFIFMTHHDEVRNAMVQFFDSVYERRLPHYLKKEEKVLSKTLKKWSEQYQIKSLESYEGLSEDLSMLCATYAYEYLVTSGIDTLPGKEYEIEELAERLHVLPSHIRLFESMMQMLVDEKMAQRLAGSIQFLIRVQDFTLSEERCESCLKKYPEFTGMIEFLDHCAKSYQQSLCGKINLVSVLFPNGSSKALEESNKRTIEYGNERIYAKAISDMIEKLSSDRKEPLKILEIGGGTGLLTNQVAETVKKYDIEYWFTDIGMHFVQEAEKKKEYEGFKFQKFDISQDVEKQGFESKHFDLVIGINVVHATKNIQDTLSNLKTLLNIGGSIMLIEATKNYPWVDMVWGLTEGWWLYEDSNLRKISPIISIVDWENCLRHVGFGYVSTYPKKLEERLETNCSLIIGQKCE